jgi:hypothetical protein
MEHAERGQNLRPILLKHLATAWREPGQGIWEVGDNTSFIRKSWPGSPSIVR